MRRTGHWLHGFLDLCLLALLSTGDDYGFGLAQRLERAGLGEVPGGTLYPALLRLEQQGWVNAGWEASDAGPRRRYYALTAEGRAVLERDATGWETFRDCVDGVVGSRAPRPRPRPGRLDAADPVPAGDDAAGRR